MVAGTVQAVNFSRSPYNGAAETQPGLPRAVEKHNENNLLRSVGARTQEVARGEDAPLSKAAAHDWHALIGSHDDDPKYVRRARSAQNAPCDLL